MHRQHMVAVLERHLPASCTVHPKKRLVDYVEPEQQAGDSTSPIRLEFADGTTATADVVIGADGICSSVRKKMFEMASKDNGDHETGLEQYIDATFTGKSMFRFLVPAETLRKEDPENRSLKEMSGYAGTGRYFVTYLIADGTIINAAAVISDPRLTGTHYERHWVSDVSREELVKSFHDFEPDARAVIKLSEKPSKWALHVVKFAYKRRSHLSAMRYVYLRSEAIGTFSLMKTTYSATPCCLISVLVQAKRSKMHSYLVDLSHILLPRCVASLSLSTAWMYAFMAPVFYDGTRRADDLDERGVSAYERETIKQEILRRWEWMDELDDALQAWKDAESKLLALAI